MAWGLVNQVELSLPYYGHFTDLKPEHEDVFADKPLLNTLGKTNESKLGQSGSKLDKELQK